MSMSIEETPEGLVLPLTLRLRGGLHARPAARLAQEAQRFTSDISLRSDDASADAKSMLDILSLALPEESRITLLARGDDARQAREALAGCLDGLRD